MKEKLYFAGTAICILAIPGIFGTEELDDRLKSAQVQHEAIQQARQQHDSEVADFNKLAKQGEYMTTFAARAK